MSAQTQEVDVVAQEEGPGLRRLEVTVPEARVRKAFDRAYKDLAKTARVKGFRPGKVPRRVLERMYEGALGEDIERALVNETLPGALQEQGIEPVSTPSVDAQPPKSSAPFSYVALVEVQPPIDLPDLEGLPGQRPVVLVGDDEVEKEIEQLRERNAAMVEEPEGTAAENGHFLTIDFVGRIDGEPFEGGTGRDVELEIGSGRFIPGFEEQLVGAESGQDREVAVSFPDDYGSAELAGKDARFDVHVAAVKRKELPALDDEFAKDLGEFDTLDGLKDQIHQDLTESRQNQANQALRRSVLGSLVERAEFDVPPGAVDSQLDRRLRMAAQQLQGGVPDEALRGQLDRWREEWRPSAENEVRERWLLDAVAEAQSLEVDDAAISEGVEQLAASQGATPDQLAQQFGQDFLASTVREDLRRDLALDFLTATAKVEEVSDT